jgi:fumarate hydratase subunit alpha
MREIHAEEITEAVAGLCVAANLYLPPDMLAGLQAAQAAEAHPRGRAVLSRLVENAKAAAADGVPICQDTGMAVAFVTLGQEVRVVGGGLTEAIQEGVRRGYARGFLRKSIVADPLARENTGDNTPAILHYNLVPGDGFKIILAPKGFGSENMGAVKMLKPSDGWAGLRDFVVSAVQQAGGNPCPPLVVGVGVGGTMEYCAYLAKRALLRPLGQPHPAPAWAAFEAETLEAINRLGIGPAGLGGRATALAVHAEPYPTHIAGLPAAVNLGCHVTRHQEVDL